MFTKYIDNKKNYIAMKQISESLLPLSLPLQQGGKTDKQISEKDLIDLIEKNTKSSMREITDENGIPDNNIANYGMNPGDMAIRDGGEYNGLVIRALEVIKPILTDQRVIRAIRHLIKSDAQNAIGVLRLNDEVIEHGLGIIYETLSRWLSNNDIEVPVEYSAKATSINSRKLNDWIDSFNWGPVNGAFEIVEIGFNKSASVPVVPEQWINRKFNNAIELHKEMDKLEWRKNKPPVNFCAINAMSLVNVSKMQKISEIKDDKKLNIKIGMSIGIQESKIISDSKVISEIRIFDQKSQFNEWIQKFNNKMTTITQDLNTGGKLIAVFDYNELFEKTPKYIKKRSVGLLVSMLQKLLRRGPECSQGLEEVVTELWRSPGYNLPEQQFLRVSACRQLSWRLFITCIEDIQAYETKDPMLLSMQDLAILSIISNTLTDIQLNEFIFKKLLATALSVQQIDNKWELMKNEHVLMNPILSKDQNDELLNSFIALHSYMPTREWDDRLIQASFNFIKKKLFVPKELKIKKFHDKSNKKKNEDGILAGMDMHPYPNILIVFQGSLPFIPYDPETHTTRKLWNFIWNKSSGVNYRLSEVMMDQTETLMFNILRDIQKNLLYPEKTIIDTSEYDKIPIDQANVTYSDQINDSDSRLGFILLFGQKKSFKYKNKKYDIVMAGYEQGSDEICKIKYLVGEESKYLEDQKLKQEIIDVFFKDYVDQIDHVDPPIGYEWIWGNDKKIKIKTTNDSVIKFYVNETEIKLCDASKVMKKIIEKKSRLPPKSVAQIIKRALYVDAKTQSDGYMINLLMRLLHEKKFPQYEWVDIAKKSDLPINFWVAVLVKLHNNFENEILIGPVDGQGNSLRDSINYMYEGTIWRIFNMFSMLFPETILVTNASKSLRFKINQMTPGYLTLTRNLNQMIQGAGDKNKEDDIEIKVVTKLWDHQKKTVDKIMKEIDENQRHGFGNASSVGAGKTLSALAVMAILYEKMKQSGNPGSHEGFLVLLPTQALYKTWEDEIVKHIKGLHIVFQHANGELTDKIRKNSILITTLGRMRDHPLSQPWIFVVIDECLSVQNKNALQTEQAWCQISVSLYGVLLCSATFFRARFDKLFYMLKMLKTGLPENKQYLDAILAESIIMDLPLKTREWEVNYNPMKLSKKLRKAYDQLLALDLTSERMYGKLLHFLHANFDYVGAFSQVLEKCESKGQRCLIYAKSKDQADLFSEQIKGVSRFPDTSGKHLAISFAEGTFGLNHLIYLNCIITLIPDPDKLPQMKGRLDRPGQKSDRLSIEYVYVEHTIDQGALFKMEMMNSFYKDYLLPLADFYDIAVGRKSGKDIIKNK